MTDPTTPAGRAELRRLLARGSARAVFGWMIEHGPTLLDALDEAECEIERLRGDLVIERRRARPRAQVRPRAAAHGRRAAQHRPPVRRTPVRQHRHRA